MAVSTSVSVNDNMSAAFANITMSINACLGAFMDMQQASAEGFHADLIENARNALTDVNEATESLVRNMSEVNDKQEQVNRSIARGTVEAGGLLGKVTQIAAAYVGFNTIKEQISDAVNYASDLMEVQNVVDVTFGDAADSVNKWAQTTLEAYGINELNAKNYAGTMGAMLKSSQVADDMVQQMSTNITALAGDMASFYNLDSDTAFEKIRSGLSGETEPLKQLGINMSVANLEAYRMAQGIQIAYSDMDQASQTLLRYNYLTSVTADAQGDFARTSGSYANQTKLLHENWQAFTGQLAAQAIPTLTVIVQHLNNLITGAEWLGNAISENWGIIEPILIGATVAMTAYTVALGAGKVAMGAHAVVMTIHKALTSQWSIATFTATVGQEGLNAAMYACPITWIIGAILLLIAALYAIVGAYNKVTGATVSTTGIIGGAFATLGAHVLNRFVVPTWNAFASISNFMANVFNNPVAAIEVLFYDMVLTVLGYINNLASAIETVVNRIPGMQVDITSGLDSFYNELEAAQKEVKDESGWREVVGKMNYFDYNEAAAAGYSVGTKVENKVKDFFSFSDIEMPDMTQNDTLSTLGDISSYTAATADGTKDIKDSLDITEENLKWMKDIAEREVIDRTVFRDITVSLGGVSNTVNNMNDLDGIPEYLGNVIAEQMAVSAEGAH